MTSEVITANSRQLPPDSPFSCRQFTVQELVHVLQTLIRQDSTIAAARVFLAESEWSKGMPLQVIEVKNNSCTLSDDDREEFEQLTVVDLLSQLTEHMKEDDSFQTAKITHTADTFLDFQHTAHIRLAKHKLSFF